MENIERFNLPPAPQGVVFPEPEQLYVTVIMWSVLALLAAICLYQAWKPKSPIPVLLLAGSAICYLNEPIVDVLALCWHPRANQWVALETYGPVPFWGLALYMIYFGAMTYLMLVAAQRGISRRAFWLGMMAFWIVDVACEWPIIHYGLYRYYGDPPYLLLGLPMYWLFINTIGPLFTVALLLRAPQFFSGWRQLLVLLLPMTADAAGSIAAGWPIMSALNTPGASPALKWGAATLTIVIGLVIIEGMSRLICSERATAARYVPGTRAFSQARST